MSPEDESEVSEIEAALGSLVPTRSGIDRDRVMYQAGLASVQPQTRGQRRWMAVAASLGLVAMGEAAMLARRPPERVVERIVVIREPSAPVVPVVVSQTQPQPQPPTTPVQPAGPGPGPRDRLAWQMLRYGLDGLAVSSPSTGAATPPSRRSLREEIDKVLDLGDPS